MPLPEAFSSTPEAYGCRWRHCSTAGEELPWDMTDLRILRARMILPTVPNPPRRASIPGSSKPVIDFSWSSVGLFAACRRIVDLRSNLSEVGSTLDICRSVIPRQIVRNPMTSVMIDVAGALRPWNRMIDVISVALVNST